MGRTIGGVALKWILPALLVIGLVAFISARLAFTNSGKARQEAANARGAQAMQQAGQVAVSTVLEQADEEVTLNQLVAEASKEIDDAPTPAAARAATLNAACQLRLYRDDPACAVRRASAEEVGGGRSGAPAP